MAARECEIEMTLEILDEVAFLFVEQFDNLYGMLVDRTDVKRIRKSADDGEDGLFEAMTPQNFTVVNHMTTSWIIVTLARAISII